jgi:ring-1,2-phenylacetyl-CoA epoxidase subunit PaaE
MTTRPPRTHELAVKAIDRLTDDAVAISFVVPPELSEEYRFIQGQHLSLRAPALGDSTRRSYSICSSAVEPDSELRVAVKRLPGGLFSGYVHDQLRTGDLLEVLTPAGRFFSPLDPTRSRRYAAVAAGSGITPILSIISTTLAVEPASSFTLLYQNRTVATTMFLEELAALKDRHLARLQLLFFLSEEDRQAELFSGRLDAKKLSLLLETDLGTSQIDEWFLCGPLEMTETLRDTLVTSGVDTKRVHRELFHVRADSSTELAPQRPKGPGKGEDRSQATPAQSDSRERDEPLASTVRFLLDGRSSTFVIRDPSLAILDGVLAVRPDAPYSCRNGVCGTCRALLVSGDVEMIQNYALEEDELSTGFVLTCQARCTSNNVVLDYDR